MSRNRFRPSGPAGLIRPTRRGLVRSALAAVTLLALFGALALPAAAQTTDPVWSAIMTAGDTRIGHGYDATDPDAATIGKLDDDDFDYGSLLYSVLAIDVAPNVVRFVVAPGELGSDETLTLEFGGHALAFSDRIVAISIGQSLIWSVPDALDDLDTEFPVGSTATVCLRTATQVCPAGSIVIPPTLSIADAEATEGSPVIFTATLSATATADVMATWTASIESDDTAVLADLGTTTTGQVMVTAGQLTGTFMVPTAPDETNERNETFTVTLSNASNAQLAADPTATGTIVANAAPSFSSSAEFDAAENQTSAGTVLATDGDTGDDITGYAITGGADQAFFSIGATSGELTFKTAPDYEMPSDAGTDNVYEVTVMATSGTGARVKTATQMITVTVNNIGAPGKPAKPTVTAVPGVAELSVTWQEPDLNGGPAITGYRVDYRKEPHGRWTRFSYRGTDASTTITGLTAHTEYLVRVQATNAEGTGGWSDPSDAVRTEGPTCTLDPDDPGDVWCGVVTVGNVPSFGYGYSVPFTHPNQSDQSTPQVGGLSNRNFMFRDKPYRIDLIVVEYATGNFKGGVLFALTSLFPEEDTEDLVLYIGETSLSFRSAETSGSTYRWDGDNMQEGDLVTPGPGQDWSMDTEVELRLRVNAPPVFTSAAGFTVDENERSVGEVRATDADPGDTYIRYEITGGADQAFFSIGATSGELTFDAAPNYEDAQDQGANNTYVVEVEARSGEDEMAFAEQVITNRTQQTITVRVTDVNTEAPGRGRRRCRRRRRPALR